VAGLLGVQLHHGRGRALERRQIGQQVDPQARIHDVHDLDPAALDEL
jgi:hypothetical protein